MRILYGVQGTGNGHIARARIMAAALQKHTDVTVDFVFSGRDPDKYFDMDVFGDYRTLPGLSFTTRHGQVDKWATFRQNNLRRFFSDVRTLDVSGYDLLVNDFEPITAWAAKRHKVPAISISHQAAFTYPVPKSGDNLLDRILLRYFAPCEVKLGVHWFHFNQPIVPPFICDKSTDPTSPAHILVYLPFEDVNDIQIMLEPLSEYHFVCYHPAVSTTSTNAHISWHPPSKAGFARALSQSRGVIANGGFELSSEALHLGKKLLIKPLHGQFEQLSNVLTLSQLELCQTLFQLDTDIVEEWLEAPATEAIIFPDDPTILINWLKSGDLTDTQPLCDALWKQVKYGDRTRQKLLSLAF